MSLLKRYQTAWLLALVLLLAGSVQMASAQTAVNDPSPGDEAKYTVPAGVRGITVNGKGVMDNDTGINPAHNVSVQLVSNVDYGSLQLGPNGSFNYAVPAADQAAPKQAQTTFTYRIFNASTGQFSNTATVTIYIAGGMGGGNTAPVAEDDAFSTDEHTPISGDVLADNGNGEDSDADNDPLTVTQVNGSPANVASEILLPSGAVLAMNPDGTFDYDPNGAFEALGVGEDDTDSFTYTISDGNGGTDQASVTITITGLNDAPVAEDDAFTTDEDSEVSGNVLDDNGNGADSDVDGDALTVSLVTDVTRGTLLLNADGSFTFDPDGDFESLNDGDDDTESFVYEISDGNGGTDQATVTITITGVDDPIVNNPPVLNPIGDHNLHLGQNINFSVNASDPDGDALTFSATGLPPSLSINPANGKITGLLTENGIFSVTITVTDDGTPQLSDSETITVTVTQDAPVVNVTKGTEHNTIQEAINAADPGDKLVVAGQTFVETLDITKSLTIQGAGSGSTIVDASSFADYSIFIQASNVSISGLTLLGNPNPNGTYGFKIEGVDEAEKHTNVSLSDIVVEDARRTGIDVNGIDGLTLTNVSASGATSGNGISLTDSDNVVVDGATTSGNAWGGIAIYTYGRYFPLGSENVSLANITSDEANPIYKQIGNFHVPASPEEVVNLMLPTGYDYAVRNHEHRDGGENFTFYFDDEQHAIDYAVALHSASIANTASYLNQLSTGEFIVGIGVNIAGEMYLQAAVDAAEASDVVNVRAGSYSQGRVDVDVEGLSILGADLASEFDGGLRLLADDITISGMTILNGNDSLVGVERFGIYMPNTSGHMIQNNVLTGPGSGRGLLTLHGSSSSDVTVSGNVIEDWTSGAYLNPATSDWLFEGNTIRGNLAGIAMDTPVNVLIRHNVFTGNEEGVGVNDPTNVVVRYNTFSGNTEQAVGYHGGAGDDVDARYNYWGANDGPGTKFPDFGFITDPVTGALALGSGDDIYSAGEPDRVRFDPFIADNIAISAGTYLAASGDDLVVLITADDDLTGKGVISYEFDLTFDPAVLSFVSASTSGTLSDGMIVQTSPGDGKVTVLAAGANALAGDGTLIELTFSTLAEGDSPLSFGSVRLNQGNPQASGVDGYVTVDDTPIGDVTGMGGISSADASAILSFLADPGNNPLPHPENCDVSGDGQCTAYDAALILQYSSGLISCFPVQNGCSVGMEAPPVGMLSFDATTSTGDLLALPVTVKGGQNVTSAQFTVTFDPSHYALSELASSLPADWMVTHQVVGGELRVAMAGVTPLDAVQLGELRLRKLNPNASGAVSATGFVGETEAASFEVKALLPEAYELKGSYPNPFTTSASIEYALAEASEVKLVIYNTLGQVVRVLVDTSQEAGTYTAKWDGTNASGQPVASGMYLYRLEAGDFTAVQKLTLVK